MEREPNGTNGHLSSELSLLAAVRPALDNNAVQARRNVLVDTVLVILHRDQAASAAVLADRIGKLFRTSAVPVPLVQTVLASAPPATVPLVERLLGVPVPVS